MPSRTPRNWKAWIRDCVRDPGNPIDLPRVKQPLAVLTAQDTRALDAIHACWELYFSSDEDGGDGAIAAVRALLPALQPHCRRFARELIPFSGDWSHREKLWPLVLKDEDFRPHQCAALAACGREHGVRFGAARILGPRDVEIGEDPPRPPADYRATGCTCEYCSAFEQALHWEAKPRAQRNQTT